MTAYGSSVEAVSLGEAGGDEDEDIQRDTVNIGERVLPLADTHERK